MAAGRTKPVTTPVPAPGDDVTSTSARGARRARSVGRLRQAVEPRLRRYRSPLIVVAGSALVLAGQLAEDLADSPPLQLLSPALVVGRWTVIVAVLYMLASVELVGAVVDRSIGAMRRVVKIDDAAFEGYAARMRGPSRRVDLALLGISTAIVVWLFVATRTELPASNDPVTEASLYLPADPVGGLFVLAGYTVVGWAGLRLVLSTVQLARVLGRMSREPLDINVFDTTNLLAFGNVALANSMAPAGVIVILLFGLGQPETRLGLTVLLLATGATLLALLLPLRAIHREMARAKSAALEELGGELREVHRRVGDERAIGGEEMGVLSDRTSLLVDLRKSAQEMTTWPFRDTVTFGRAVLIASAPLVYTVLSELIRVFWIAPLSS
jgi:hypothetical protein